MRLGNTVGGKGMAIHPLACFKFHANRGITRGVARVLATFKGNFMSPKSAPFDSSPQRGEPERYNLAPLSEESFIEI